MSRNIAGCVNIRGDNHNKLIINNDYICRDHCYYKNFRLVLYYLITFRVVAKLVKFAA